MAKKQTFTGEESDEELVAAYREQEDASYARNKLLRNIGSVVIVAGLLVYLLGPGEPFDVWKSVLLVVLFAGIMAVTYWQQKVREYVSTTATRASTTPIKRPLPPRMGKTRRRARR